MNPQKRPAFLLDGIQMAHKGGAKQYDSKKDKHLKDFNQNLHKKSKDKEIQRFHTDSNRQPNNSSILSLNQSIQLHQRASVRQNQLNRVYTQNPYPDYSMSPKMQTRLQNTPKNKREGGLSLPKLDSTNSNLQKPVTREQLLQFLDQIMFAVENVQYIVSQYENPPSDINQSQPVRQMAKFKITQEQQTDHSYIQSQLKSKQHYVNKVNKKTQTPNKQIRANSQNYEQQIINQKSSKIKTEFTEESDGTEKRPTRFPNIIQQSQKQKIEKILPQNRKNRVQSQVISYCYVNQKDNEQNQQENTNKQISNNVTQQNSDQSNIIYESSQQNLSQTNIDLKNKKQITPQNETNLVETQKKQQQSPINNSNQLQKTNQNAMIIQLQNKQDGNQSIQQISSNRYSLSDFEDADQEVLKSKSSLQDQQISQKQQVNTQKTPKVKKRPIQIKNTNQIDINDQDEYKSFDQKTIELRQNTNEQLSKAQQIQSHSNQEDQEFSNEFLSEQTKPLTKNSSNTKNQQQINKLSQKQTSSKKILQINPDPEFYPDNSQTKDIQYNKQNEQNLNTHQNDQKQQQNEQINQQDTNVEAKEQKNSNQNQQIEPEIQNQSQLMKISNNLQKSQTIEKSQISVKSQEQQKSQEQLQSQQKQKSQEKLKNQENLKSIEQLKSQEKLQIQEEIKSQENLKNQEQLKSQENKQNQHITPAISQDLLQNKEEIQNSKDLRPQSVKQNQEEQIEVNSIVNSIYVQPNELAYKKSSNQNDVQLVQNQEIQVKSQQLNNQQISQLDNTQKEQIIDKISNQQLNLKNNEDLGESQLINEVQSKNTENKSEKQIKQTKANIKDNFAQSHQINQAQTGFKFQPKSLQQSGAYSIIFDKDKYKNKEKTKIIADVDNDQLKSKQTKIDETKKQKQNFKTHKSLQITENNQNYENQQKNIKSQILNGQEELDEELIKLLNQTKKIEQNTQIIDEVKNDNTRSDKLSKQKSTEKLQQSQVIVVENQENNNQDQPQDKQFSILDKKSQNNEINDSLQNSQLQNKEQVILVQSNEVENNKKQDNGMKQSNIQEQNNSQVQPFLIEKLNNKDPQAIDQN